MTFSFYCNTQEKESQWNPETGRRKEIREMKQEMESRKTVEKISESKSWFFEKIYKIEKLLFKHIRF